MSYMAAMMGERPFTLLEMICSLVVLLGSLAVFRSLKHREIEMRMGGKLVKVIRAKEPKSYWFWMAIDVSIVSFFLIPLLSK